MLKKLAVFQILLCFCMHARADTRDLYEILGVPQTATESEIKSAHRKLALMYHPDRNQGDQGAAAKFREVQEAYETLGDPERRGRYDKDGSIGTKANDFNWRQYQEREEARRIEALDQYAREKPNLKWPYHFGSHRYYDNRTRKWLILDKLFFSFRSEEGWIFNPENGTYYSNVLVAQWNPEDELGWYRYVSNSSNKIIPIDYRTGFAKSIIYDPKTTSNASHLFDQVFNPVLLADGNDGRFDRNKLIRDLVNLKWDAEQRADFIERAHQHIQIFNHPLMQPRSSTDRTYVGLFIESIIDNPKSQEHFEIVVTFIRHMSNKVHGEVAELLRAPKWINHENSKYWFDELFKNEAASSEFVRIMHHGLKTEQITERTRKIFPFIKNAGFKPRVIDALIKYYVHGPNKKRKSRLNH